MSFNVGVSMETLAENHKEILVNNINMINTQASNDKNVIVNLFIHEQKYYQDYLNKGYLEYTYGSGNTIARNASVKTTFDKMAKYGAITTQMAHPTWNKTPSNFKLGIANYATRLVLQIKGLNGN